jgi:predicted DNA-binding transcriptional regulator AlpA
MAREIIHIEDFAEQCGVSVATARFWVSKDYAPPHAKLGKRLVFDQSQVDHWLEEKFTAARKGA